MPRKRQIKGNRKEGEYDSEGIVFHYYESFLLLIQLIDCETNSRSFINPGIEIHLIKYPH